MTELIKTKFGILKGIVQKNVLSGSYFAFKGIPYAEPPVGKLRFQVSLFKFFSDEANLSNKYDN